MLRRSIIAVTYHCYLIFCSDNISFDTSISTAVFYSRTDYSSSVADFYEKHFSDLLCLTLFTLMIVMCLVQIREEVSLLLEDMYLRLKRSLFAGVSTAFLSIFLPCVFVPVSHNIANQTFLVIVMNL